MNNIQSTHLLNLHKASIQNQLVVFVGAGVSANSGVPTWNNITESFKSELPNSIEDETDDMKVAQIYKDTYGEKAYFDKIQNILKNGRVAFNPIHKAILQLNPVHIITTNYDNLIEQSIKSNYKQYDIITRDSDLPYYRYPNKVVKMHGDFRNGNIVLTEEDYYNYAANFPLIRSFVTSLFTTNVVLFVGFSFSDLNLKIILNDIKTILNKNMQRVYLLTNDIVDNETHKYYENKGINIVDFNPDDYISSGYGISIENEELNKLDSSKGKNLYKQLRIICGIDNECVDDLLGILYKRLNSIQTELIIVGDGLKYFFPKGSFQFWNYYSNGLQINSDYFIKLNDRLKSYEGKRAFVSAHPKKQRLFLLQQADLNQIWEIDGFRIITEANQKKIKNSFDENLPIDYFYELDFDSLYRTLRILEKQGFNYNYKDLLLPYLLCRVGKYYDAYKRYKILLPEFWDKKLYVLYYICLYNLHHIRFYIEYEALGNPNIDANYIVNEIEQYNLNNILLKLPIDDSVKDTLKDLVSYKLFSEKARDVEELFRKIHRQKKQADRGGVSLNSNIYSLLTKFQRTIQFCLLNCIEFNNPYFPNLVRDTISAIINSHITPNNKLAIGFDATRIEVLDQTHLTILLFFVNTDELSELFKQYDAFEISFNQDAIHEFETLILNLYRSLFENGRFKKPPFNIDIICNIIGNMVFLIGKSKNSFSNESTENLYSIIHNLWGPLLGNTIGKYLHLMVKKCPPTDEMAMNLLEDSIEINPYNSKELAKSVKKQLKKNNLLFDRIKDISILCKDSECQLGLELYEVLPPSLQTQFGEYVQQKSQQLLMYLYIIDSIKTEIIDIKHFNELLKNPHFSSNEQISWTCWFLANMRKNKMYLNVHSIIDDFGNHYEQYIFYLNPFDYQNTDALDAEWILKLGDAEIIKLSRNVEIKKILKNAILSNNMERNSSDRLVQLLL